VTDEWIGLDAIEEVGHGHQFLKSKHTRRFMRDEITQWDPAKLEMLKSDAATVITEVNSIAEQLLKDHEVLAIEESLIQQGDEIIRAYEGSLAARLHKWFRQPRVRRRFTGTGDSWAPKFPKDRPHLRPLRGAAQLLPAGWRESVCGSHC
jgi:hypothetical protein